MKFRAIVIKSGEENELFEQVRDDGSLQYEEDFQEVSTCASR